MGAEKFTDGFAFDGSGSDTTTAGGAGPKRRGWLKRRWKRSATDCASGKWRWSSRKSNLKGAEANLFSIEMKHESERFRRVNQVLKDKLDWYVPLEDVLGVPIIGVDMEEFITSVQGREDIAINMDERFGKLEERKSFFFKYVPNMSGATTVTTLSTAALR